MRSLAENGHEKIRVSQVFNDGYNLKNFFHWGPLTAIAIIQTITLTTLYMNSMWCPPFRSLGGFINQFTFIFLTGAASYHFGMSITVGPGLVEKKWHPQCGVDAEQMQYCKECHGYKAPRSHHCRKCNRCVKKMDHHCPWINNCVGWGNQAHFVCFLGFSILGSLHACIILSLSFYRGVYRYYYLTHNQFHLATVQFTMVSIIFCIFAMGLSIGVVIALSLLLYYQAKSIITNMTAIELWIVEKSLYRRNFNPGLPKFIYPYDLGWRQNIYNVFLSSAKLKGNGMIWPVVEGCDQYTLTREQLAQKEEKRARTRVFKCIRPATGSYFPLLSQGVMVCWSSPCTDEARIRLQLNDIVRVTRFRKNWLFGERDLREDELQKIEMVSKESIRGWFPRRCAVDFIDMHSKIIYSSGDEHNNKHKKDHSEGNLKQTRRRRKQNGIGNGNINAKLLNSEVSVQMFQDLLHWWKCMAIISSFIIFSAVVNNQETEQIIQMKIK